jgi:CDP-glucose 4,6-dehydratase
MGTLNLLEATKSLDTLRATIIITSDKVYKNNEQLVGYTEKDPLFGSDPYSNSKALADLATQSWRQNFGSSPISIARAGNVIGGGDSASARLIPDIVKSIDENRELFIRYPNAIRPWQHVLDCLRGYWLLMNKQIESSIQGEWNFGPDSTQYYDVKTVITKFYQIWGTENQVVYKKPQFHEHSRLILDTSLSRQILGWSEKLNFHESLTWTADWYKNRNQTNYTVQQIEKFLSL